MSQNFAFLNGKRGVTAVVEVGVRSLEFLIVVIIGNNYAHTHAGFLGSCGW